MELRGVPGPVLALLLAFASGACLPKVDEVHVNTVEPASSSGEEQYRSNYALATSLDGDVLHVTATERHECGTGTPMQHVEGTRRSLSSGVLAQGLNLALAGGFVALGVGAYAAAGSGSCTTMPTPTPTDPNPSPLPCTSDQQQQQTGKNQAVAVFLGSLALVPLGAFVWNLFRAKDDVQLTPAPVEVNDWHACGERPLANAPIILTAGGMSLTGRTDDRGQATLDVSSLSSAQIAPQVATIDMQGGATGSSTQVSLTGTPAFAAWQTAERQRSALAKTERERVAREASGAAWARAEGDQRQRLAALLDRAEADLAYLEQAKEPWGESEFQHAADCGALLKEAAERGAVGFEARFQQDFARLMRTKPAVERGLALKKQRDEAATAAAVRWGSGPTDSSHSPTNDENEQRHQRERAEDEQRHQRERAEDEQQHQREREEDARKQEDVRREERHRQLVQCDDRCEHEETDCSNRCSEHRGPCGGCGDAKRTCYEQCHSTYGD